VYQAKCLVALCTPNTTGTSSIVFNIYIYITAMTTQAAGLLILTQANGWMSIQTAVVYIWNKT